MAFVNSPRRDCNYTYDFVKIKFISGENPLVVHIFWQLFRCENSVQNVICLRVVVYEMYGNLSLVERRSLGEDKKNEISRVLRRRTEREHRIKSMQQNNRNTSLHWNFAHLSAYKSSYWLADNFVVDRLAARFRFAGINRMWRASEFTFSIRFWSVTNIFRTFLIKLVNDFQRRRDGTADCH